MDNFTQAEIRFVRSHAESTIINETTRLGQDNMSSDHANWTRERIELARGLLAKLEEKDEPITAEWLEQVGAEKSRGLCPRYTVNCQSYIDIVVEFERSADVELMVFVRVIRSLGGLPHIQNRHQVSELYRLLSSRELKQ